MPELDGVKATRQIRALPAPKCSVPIIAMTAHAMAGAREEYLAAGMNDYISKPIQPTLLLSKLAGIVGCDAQQAPKSSAPKVAALSTQTIDNAVVDEPQLLDLEKLTELEAALPPAALRNFIALYLTDVDLHLAWIAECRANGDFEGVSQQAHTIVSIAGNLGAMRTSAAARRLETACRNGDHELCQRLIGELNQSGEASSAALRAWSDGRSSSMRAIAS